MSSGVPSVPEWPGATSEESRWLGEVVEHLAAEDGPADEGDGWPDRLWRVVVASGAPRWSIASAFGGEPCGRFELMRRYGRMAEGSLTAAFLQSQQDAAVRRLGIAGEAGRATAERWLREVAAGTAYATVGISHLTTSRRLGSRALTAREIGGGGFELEGAMPWVTGAPHAKVLVTGAMLEDGKQVMVALPTDQPRVVVEPPFSLAALQASCTSEVVCEGVRVPAEDVLAGPSEGIMSLPGQVGTGGLETSALSLGLSRAALKGLAHLAGDREELAEATTALCASWLELAEGLAAAAEQKEGAMPAAQIRSQANSLVLRTTQAYLTTRKGTGFLRSDPAQRLAREALFFLVWSCPSPIATQAVRELAGLCPG